jgi:glycosyltransferase involved in cell wall biosynthesis
MVVFVGESGNVPELLALMRVSVLASLTESFPNAVLEAMACALPVVATNVGGVPELVTDGETGYLVPTENPDALADRILKILDNPGLASGMGNLARKRAVEKFSCDKLIENVEALYAQVLNGQ